MVRSDFASKHNEEHVALIAALLEACEFCDQPENHEQIIKTLARTEYVGAPEAALRHGITGEMDLGHDRKRTVRDFCVFHRDSANAPSGDKVAWAIELLRSSGMCPESTAINFAFARNIFRPDIYKQAVRLSDPTHAENLKPETKYESHDTEPQSVLA